MQELGLMEELQANGRVGEADLPIKCASFIFKPMCLVSELKNSTQGAEVSHRVV